MRSRRWARILIANLLAGLTVLLLLELPVRWYTSRYPVADIEMTRYALELKVASSNPRLGHLHKADARAHLMGVDIALSSAGLRDQEYPRQPGTKRRLLFLGDSLTLGWGVAQHQTFADLLEQALPDTEILNFGVGNYNTEQEVELLLERGFEFCPDEVVVFWFINDAEPTPSRSPWIVLGRCRGLTLLWSSLQRLSWHWRGRTYLDHYRELYEAEAMGWQRQQEAFARLKALCADKEVGLKVILLPELHILDPYPFEEIHSRVRAMLEAQGISVLDVREAFAEVEEPGLLWVAPDDAHPNADGHALIAKACSEFLHQPPEVTAP